MTLTATKTVSTPTKTRPASVVALISLLIFLGVTALAGGAAMVFGIGDGVVLPPADWLDGIPLIETWVLPGLVLGIGFGLGASFAAYGMLRLPRWDWASLVERPTGHHWSWIAALLLGLGQVMWISLELIYLPEPSWLNAMYGVVGLGLILLAIMPSVRSHLKLA
ncbi:MAG TPA: hypothetical protein VIH55_03870 [Acidimicrobiia bacterium]